MKAASAGKGSGWAWALAAAVFCLLASVTVLVWREQVGHLRQLQARHTEDVAGQAARRLSVFVDSHIRAAHIFARRWATHEERDYSHTRFDEFARVLIDELPGFAAIVLLSRDHPEPWSVPPDAPVAALLLASGDRPLLEAASAGDDASVSAPFAHPSGEVGFFAVLPLVRDGESLGQLAVYFLAATLIDDCFHSRIQEEFSFEVYDGEIELFRWLPEPGSPDIAAEATRAELTFPVRNRTWRLSMAPRRAKAAAVGWAANLGVPLFGFPMSLGLAWLVLLLHRRVVAVRREHARALHEIEGRRRVEAELRASERRHALLSRKVLVAQEEERARLSRELHDELGQLLTALRLELGWLQKRARQIVAEHPAEFNDTVSLVERATQELRRICRGLRPPLLDDLGLTPALRQLVEEHEERLGIAISYQVDLDEEKTPVAPEVGLCTYRVLQESLTNIGRHAAATEVAVTLRVEGSALALEVVDDGVGFDPAHLGGGACGLEGMRERAALVSAAIEVESSRGRGTRVRLRAPLASPGQEDAT